MEKYEQTFFKGRRTDHQQAHSNMLSNTNKKGNVEQKHNDISFHTIRMAIIKKTRNNKCQQGSGEKGMLMVGMQIGVVTGKQHGGCSKY